MSTVSGNPLRKTPYKTRDIAALTGWTPGEVIKQARAGKIPKAVRLGPRSYRWNRDEFDAWLAAQGLGAPGAA
jgi:predicted DNA-binding transcriptional regulator AlpA